MLTLSRNSSNRGPVLTIRTKWWVLSRPASSSVVCHVFIKTKPALFPRHHCMNTSVSKNSQCSVWHFRKLDWHVFSKQTENHQGFVWSVWGVQTLTPTTENWELNNNWVFTTITPRTHLQHTAYILWSSGVSGVIIILCFSARQHGPAWGGLEGVQSNCVSSL